MKASRYFILSFPSIAFALSLLVTGCEETPSSSGGDPVMQATVDGNAWSAGNNVDGTLFSSLKSITGTAGDGSAITINLKDVTSTGTLDIDGLNVTASYISGSTSYTATEGTVTVTELDASNNISGTFEFNGETSTGAPVEIENGSFSAALR